MNYYSTNSKDIRIGAEEAVFRGLPPDNGLYMPEFIPRFSEKQIASFKGMSLPDIGMEVLHMFFEDIPEDDFRKIIDQTLCFDMPLVAIGNNYSLELFHGPTLAFKDVGAGILAGCLDYYSRKQKQKVTVLVATSGDTGSAVAHGFYGKENVEVVILYPSGKISHIQEQQMTTLGKNITALEIEGSFDDCQRMVKESFLDRDLQSSLNLTSANSINIARFLSQTIYYFYAWSKLPGDQDPVISVPSGNFGNLTAGIVAKKMGLPIAHFIASTNINDVVPEYLISGTYRTKESVSTISNAMDVGRPSNFIRIQDMHEYELVLIRKEITGYRFTDEETRQCIAECYRDFGYILDPHGAVAYLGLDKYQKKGSTQPGIFLETAHPYKFKQEVEIMIERTIDPPEQIQNLQERESKSIRMEADFIALKKYLLRN